MMGSYIILYISKLLPVWELASGSDVTEGTDWCGLVPVVREFLHMFAKDLVNGPKFFAFGNSLNLLQNKV